MTRAAPSAALVLALLSAAPAAWARSRQVILLIGDGMGLAVEGFGETYSATVLESSAPLHLQDLMRDGTTGLLITRSADRLVTDSAAAATAMACGEKTNNDVVGMDPAGRPLTNLLELAKARGLATGVVTTDSLTGATPAAFTAHAAHRRQAETIASQQVKGRHTVLFGGGRDDFDLPALEAAGYGVMTRKKDLVSGPSLPRPMWLGVFAAGEIPYVEERGPDVPSLPEMTRAALTKLAKDPEGFFLVVEGARIDHAAHANEADKMVREFLEFDATVGVARDFLKSHPEASAFVTADHDTGGVALSKADSRDDYPAAADLAAGRGVYWISHNHTAAPVLLVGAGPDGAGAAGWRDNTDVFSLVKGALGL